MKTYLSLLLLITLAATFLFLLRPAAYAGTFTDGLNTAKGVASAGGLNQNTDVKIVLKKMTNWLLSIVGAVAMLALIYGSVRMIASFGNDEAIKDAKNVIKWAIVGVMFAGLSYVILLAVYGFLT